MTPDDKPSPYYGLPATAEPPARVWSRNDVEFDNELRELREGFKLLKQRVDSIYWAIGVVFVACVGAVVASAMSVLAWMRRP